MASVKFTINGKPFEVNSSKGSVNTTLNTFIRDVAQLKGTKFMCWEGGCGVCIVTVRGLHPVTKQLESWGVNSCLTPILSCHGWEITTVEGLGNKEKGYHAVQSRLAKLNGTQCGYCSPGMVMNMYSLLEANAGEVTMEQIENSFGGNICRCTGYRPILDAFKTFAVDASEKHIEMIKDIEDIKICPKNGTPCSGKCANGTTATTQPVHLTFQNGSTWQKAYTVKDIFNAFNAAGDVPYMLVGGNTAHGVYRRPYNLKAFIDVNDVEELRSHKIGTELLTIGGNVKLTEFMNILKEASATSLNFKYASYVVQHIDLVANVPVRNTGTIAGNLMIKHQHNEFPSDVFVALEAVEAKITIALSDKSSKMMSLAEFLKTDMRHKVILNVILPAMDSGKMLFRCYKIMPRAQNAHAYVNAGFLVEVDKERVITARICFGGINPKFCRASLTEQYLIGKNLFDSKTLQAAIHTLNTELDVDWELPDASPVYRKNLAISLFYKFVLAVCPEGKLRKQYKSGGNILKRDLSSGTQVYDTYENNWPLTKPVKKYESLIQCSGEAQYVNDIPKQPHELAAVFVPSTVVHAEIVGIDASEALKVPGVVAFLTAKDIPGVNSFMTPKLMMYEEDEDILCSGLVKYHGQAIGLMVAETVGIAYYASKLLKIEYKKLEKPVVPTLKDVHEKAKERMFDIPYQAMTPRLYGENTEKSISGKFSVGGQYHYFMETLSTVCVPTDNGLDVYATSQWMDMVQLTIAQSLKIPENNINVIVRRLGGGFGGKITRACHVACAAALAAKHTNRPVRLVLSMENNMSSYGKRLSCISEYTVDVNMAGKIQKLKNHFVQDQGCSLNEQLQTFTAMNVSNCYDDSSFDVTCAGAITDVASTTSVRAPGTTEGIAMIENIMEHISNDLNLDPVAVRLANMEGDGAMKKISEDFLKQIDYVKRQEEIAKFNAENRWIKRGIAFVPMKYGQHYFGTIPALVSIYHGDGTISISHGGIEMGQGLNTKVTQVAAHILGVPLESISIKPSNNLIGANAVVSGGSFASESVCYAVKKACEQLLAGMAPVRKEMNNPTWQELVAKCFEKCLDLTAVYTYKVTELETYTTWGVSSAEVEVDVLTGNLILKRVDILEDTGESLSPLVDVGQVEGAFIMGVGYWLTENLIYNPENGELLTNRSWNYKPPGAKDIPVDFRVTFLQKSSNTKGVLRSKATGEPATCMSIVVLFALRNALKAARKDAGLGDGWFELGAPSTPDTIFLTAGNTNDQYEL